MTTLKFTTVDQHLVLQRQPTVASGDKNSVLIQIQLCPMWDEFDVKVAFYKDGNRDFVLDIPLKDGECMVPPEMLDSPCVLNIGIWGKDASGRYKTSTMVKYRISEGTPIEAGVTLVDVRDGTAEEDQVLAGATFYAGNTGKKTGIIPTYEDGDPVYMTPYTEDDPTVPAWAKQPTKPTYTPAEVGAAPAGYGRGNLITAYCLSESDVWVDKINSILKNLPYGLTYRISFQDYWTVPTQICNGILWKSGESDAFVRGTSYDGITIQRSLKSGVWQPWEYENPPMHLGVEYRTTERYKGKPVYVKVVDCGELPISTTKIVEYGDSQCRALFCYGECGGTTIPTMNFGSSLDPTFPSGAVISLWGNANTLCIACGGDRSGISTTVIVKYWKTTD